MAPYNENGGSPANNPQQLIEPIIFFGPPAEEGQTPAEMPPAAAPGQQFPITQGIPMPQQMPYGMQQGFYPAYSCQNPCPPQAQSVFRSQDFYRLANLALTAQQELARAEKAYLTLKTQQERQQAKIDALNDVLARNNRTYVLDGTHRWIELLNRQFTFALHVIPEAPSEQKPFYIIGLSGAESPLTLTDEDFHRDGILIQSLQEIPGTQVSVRRSQKHTAYLLRKAMEVETLRIPFYGGWTRTDNGKFDFLLFPGGSTHCISGCYVTPEPLTAPPQPGEAVQSFSRVTDTLTNPNVRQLFTLWFHASALTSLLDGLGFPIPLFLCLSSPNGAAADWAKAFFGSSSDAPLPLDAYPDHLNRALLPPCDQTLLIQDRSRTRWSACNAKTIEQTLVSRTVSHKDNVFPLRSLPVVLSEGNTHLSCSPCAMEVELTSSDLLPCNWEGWSDLRSRYRDTFVAYARDHQARLETLLEHCVSFALQEQGDLLSEDCARTLGILTALDRFLDEFRGVHAPELQHGAAERDRFATWLTSYLESVSWKTADTPELAGRFVAAAKGLINSGALSTAPLGSVAIGQVYYDERTLAFTRDAFRTVCARLDQSVPIILRSLDKRDLFCGKPVNTTTLMTRIRVPDGEGGRRTLPVYRLSRAPFEQVGEPLDLGGDEV